MPKYTTLYIKDCQRQLFNRAVEIARKEDKGVIDLLLTIPGVEPWLVTHSSGNPQTFLEYSGLPKTLPIWRTCRHSNKKLVDELFTCTKPSGTYHLSPENCVYVNRQQKCYRGIPDE